MYELEGLMRYKCIACDVMFREFAAAAAQTRNIIELVLMPQGLHRVGETQMSQTLQKVIDDTDTERFDAVLLGYGLCNNGVQGLHSDLPLVIPRAHDCITLLMGNMARYMEYFNSNPGTFYYSSGWLERMVITEDKSEAEQQLGFGIDREQFTELYGEDNADYIMEIFGSWEKNYSQLTYIEMGLGATDVYIEEAKKRASSNGWQYEEINGDSRLIDLMLAGEWNEQDFLVIPPGARIIPTHGEGVMGYQE